jgi:drug/metabolite transporter (DMT)-like permease
MTASGAPIGEHASVPSADLILFAAILMWSLNPVVVKVGVGEISPLAFPVLRFGLGGLAMLAVLRMREGTLGIARRDVGLLLLTAVLGVTINQACFVYALTNTGASDVAFLGATGPLVTALLATAIGLERLGKRHWLSAVAGIVGVFLIVGGGGHAAVGRMPLLGALLALGSVVCSSASALPIRSLLSRYTAWRILTYEILAGSLLLFPFALPSLASQDFGRVSVAGWASLGYSVIFTGILTNLLYFTAIGRVGPSRAAIFGYLQSFLGVLLAVIILGESVLPLQLVGGVVVIGSVVLSRRRAGYARVRHWRRDGAA